MNHGAIKSGLVACALLVAGRAGADEIKPPVKASQAVASQDKAARAQAKAAEDKAYAKAVELNGATRAQLMTLPGITGAYADQIIKGRPYNSKADLVSKHVIPADLYPGLHSLVKVIPKPPKK